MTRHFLPYAAVADNQTLTMAGYALLVDRHIGTIGHVGINWDKYVLMTPSVHISNRQICTHHRACTGQLRHYVCWWFRTKGSALDKHRNDMYASLRIIRPMMHIGCLEGLFLSPLTQLPTAARPWILGSRWKSKVGCRCRVQGFRHDVSL